MLVWIIAIRSPASLFCVDESSKIILKKEERKKMNENRSHFQIRYHSMQLLVITLFLGAKPEQNPDSPHLTPSKPSSYLPFENQNPLRPSAGMNPDVTDAQTGR